MDKNGSLQSKPTAQSEEFAGGNAASTTGARADRLISLAALEAAQQDLSCRAFSILVDILAYDDNSPFPPLSDYDFGLVEGGESAVIELLEKQYLGIVLGTFSVNWSKFEAKANG